MTPVLILHTLMPKRHSFGTQLIVVLFSSWNERSWWDSKSVLEHLVCLSHVMIGVIRVELELEKSRLISVLHLLPPPATPHPHPPTLFLTFRDIIWPGALSLTSSETQIQLAYGWVPVHLPVARINFKGIIQRGRGGKIAAAARVKKKKTAAEKEAETFPFPSLRQGFKKQLLRHKCAHLNRRSSSM